MKEVACELMIMRREGARSLTRIEAVTCTKRQNILGRQDSQALVKKQTGLCTPVPEPKGKFFSVEGLDSFYSLTFKTSSGQRNLTNLKLTKMNNAICTLFQ